MLTTCCASQLVGPLVSERDMYLAWSCQRSKAVNGTQRVVAIVGRGHLQGVYANLVKGKGALRFR